MAERCSHADVIRRWLDAHAAEVDALVYGQVTFIFSNGNPPRVKIERAEQIVDGGPRLSA